jgi:hypothetical protein
MAKSRRRQPFNPAENVHDRRSTDLLRNAMVSPIEVDDPLGDWLEADRHAVDPE